MTHSSLAFSSLGQAELSGTVSAPQGRCIYAIHVETDAVITSCVWGPGYVGPTWSSRALKAGQVYYGRWSSLVVASGTGIAHFA